jgi:sugar transferase (PEP-CTERM/EpsH1 system associated)
MHILWLKTELLHPIDKGGKIRTYQTLRHLKADHRITYLCLDDGTASAEARSRAAEYSDDVIAVPFRAPSRGSAAFFGDLARNVFSPLPYAIARYRSEAMQSAIRRAVSEARAKTPIDLLLCDFLTPSVNVPPGLGVPLALFQHNVEAAIWARHAEVPGSILRRRYMREQWRRMLVFERRECQRYDQVIAVSEADRDVFMHEYGVERTIAVPTGVDTDFFRPAGNVGRQPHQIVFIGSMDWMPNEDGVRWFVHESLPLIRRQVPDAIFTIVGRDPSPSVRALAAQVTGVTVTGTVPDVRPFIEGSAAVVVPLRVGGGTRLKIFEAMAMERPIVSTTIGAEGLPVVDGRELLIADDPVAFANATARLLLDPRSGDALGAAGARMVRSGFGWAGVTELFARACHAAREASTGRPSGRAA